MKLHLEQSDGLSLVDARRRLINHASTEGLSELRRGGKGTDTKVFHAKEEGEKRKAICHLWTRGTCHRKNCWYRHEGPGGTIEDN